MVYSNREQRQRWRKKYPEKVKEQRIKYLDRKFKKNPDSIKKLQGRILQEFDKLTRLTFDDLMPRYCEICGSTDDLHIHHKQYVLPIVKKDLQRLCRRCHVLEHQKITPTLTD